jgi:hypothetical protein
MSEDPRLSDLDKLRAGYREAQNNPADHDFPGLCIQCCSQPATNLVLFGDVDPTECSAFCSYRCAKHFAFEMANMATEMEHVAADFCKHDVPDGEYCQDCKDEFMQAAGTAEKGGAA